MQNLLSIRRGVLLGLLTCLGLLFVSHLGQAQCNNTTQYPSGNIAAPTTPGTSVTSATCSFFGEYTVFTGIVANGLYIDTFYAGGTLPSTPAGFITVREGSPSGPVIAYGPSPLTWVSTVAGTYYLHWNSPGSPTCGTDANCHVNILRYVSLANPCVDPPTAGTPTAAPLTVCSGSNTQLDITGGSVGIGQTYQWKSSSVSGGPYTNIGTPQSVSSLSLPLTSTTYFVCDVVCGTGTATTSEIMVTVPAGFPGGTYTIDQTQPASSTNFTSFSAAVAAISCGITGPITFDVVPGTGPYTEQISLPATIGSTAINTVTFNGNNEVITFNSTNTNARHTIQLNGADYITFNELNIQCTGTFGFGVHMFNGADYNTFNLCTVTTVANSTSTNYACIAMSNSLTSATTAGNTGNYNTFIDCSLLGGYYGITVCGASTVGSEVVGNNITNCIFRNFYNYGVYQIYHRDANVSMCDFARPNRTNSTTAGGVFITTGCFGLNIENNRIYDMFKVFPTSTSTCYGVFVAADATVAKPNRVINNLIYKNHHNGAFYGVYNSSADHNHIYHNTIYVNYPAGTAGLVYGIYQLTTATGVQVRNNLITIRKGGTAVKAGLYYATTGSSITSNNNIVFMTGSTGTNAYGYWGTTSYINLSNWQTANSGAFDANSVQADPAFVDTTNNDYTPTAIATNNTGAPMGVGFDINGNPRSPLFPDAGAIEYTLVGLDASISWVSPTSPTTAGLKTITVTITNNLSTPITDLSLSYTDGVTPVTENFSSLNILAGNQQTFNFTTQYNVTSNVVLRAYINSVNGVTDNNVLNDTTSIQNICLSLNGAYTIDQTQPASTTNFTSFTALAAALGCGGVAGPVTVDVVSATGPYNEQVSFANIPGSSAVNTVTINGNGNTLSFSAASGDFHTLRMNGADFMTFNNLTISATNTTQGFALVMMNQSNSNNFTGCTFNVPANTTTTLHVPVSFSSSTTAATNAGNNGNNNVFTNCTMNNGYYGISVYGNTTVGGQINGNQFYDCTVNDFYLYGVYNAYANTTIVKGCTIQRPARTTVTTTYGIFLTTSSASCLMENNRIRDLFEGAPTSTSSCYPIYLTTTATAGNENRVINNLITNIRSNGLIYAIYNIGSPFTLIYHNTVSLDHAASTATGATWGIYNSSSVGTDIRNNLVTITRGGTGTKYAGYYQSLPAVSNNNNYFINAPAGTNYAMFANATSYATLAAYQSATPTLDQASVSIDPAYNNPAANDYKPTEVTLNDLGTNVGVPLDLLGATRGATPDIGAIEFTIAPVDIGLFSFNSPGTSGCYSAAEDVVVTVKNFGTSVLDFSVTPLTVYADVQGTLTTTLSNTINSGTMNPGSTMTVTVSAINMQPVGTYTFTNIYTMLSGDGNSTNDYLSAPVVRTVGIVAGTVSSNFTGVCSGSVNPTLTLSGSYGASIQWQESTVGSTGPWTNVGTGATTYSPTLTQNTWIRVVLSCNANTDSTNVVAITVSAPVVSGTTPGSRCGIGTVDLGATAPGYGLNWFANPSGGAQLGSGTTFTTPVISATDTFYVEAVSGAGSFTGLGCTLVPTASGFNAKRGLQFDAYTNFTLNSADFYAAYAGTTNITIELQNSAGVILQTFTVNVVSTNSSPSWQTIPLNMIIPAGTGYRLLAQFNSGSLSNYSHSSGANYASPAFNNLASVGQITSGLDFGPVVSATSYWYFYNWNVSAGCSSPRVPVIATVNTPPIVTVSASSASICNGQSTVLTATSPNDPDYTYTWTPGSLSGSTVTVTPVSTTTYTLQAIDNTTGPNATCATSAVTTVTVNPNPSPLMVTPSNASVCEGTIQPLVATGGTIGGLFTLGNGSSTQGVTGQTPYSAFYENARVQYLIQASELSALGMQAGNINSMAFNVTLQGTAGAQNVWQVGYTIKMAQTTATSLGAAYITPGGGFSTVYGPVTQNQPALGWNVYTFGSPFYWDGTSNLLIDICHENDGPAGTCGTCYSNNSTVSSHTTSFNSVFGKYMDNGQACAVDASIVSGPVTNRPDIRFNSETPTTLNWSPASDLYTDNLATIPYAGNNQATVYNKPTANNTYTVTATTAAGCSVSTTASVTYNPSPVTNTSITTCGSYTWNSNTYTASGTYTFTSLTGAGCVATDILNLTITPCNTTLNLTMYIQGYWDGVSGMQPVLSNQGLTNPNTDCDSILVELHDAITPSTVAYSTMAVLQTNGTAACVFPAVVSGNYYIAVKHRNAIETWSANPVSFSGTTSYNFSTAATQAYGDNQIEVATGVWAFYSGDVVKDLAESTDLLDLAQMEFEISNFSFGYYAEDLTGDGNVDLNDSPILETNILLFISSFHP